MPDVADRHINRPLTNVSVAYMQSQDRFIASRIFPVVPVAKQSDQYYTYPKGAWFRGEAQKRPPRTESAGGDFDLETAQYFCEVFAFHRDVSDQERGNADSVFNLDSEASEFATHQVLVKRDRDFVSRFFGTGLWDIDLAGGASGGGGDFVQWDDYANSDPVGDVQQQSLAIAAKTGYTPNVLVLGPQTFRAIRNHPDILDRIKFTQRGIITEDVISAVFGVDRVVVPRAIANSASEGAADDIDFMFGDGALLAYAAPSPGLLRPSAGYIFEWTGLPGGAGGLRTGRFRMEHLKADRIEVESTWDMRLVASDLGAYFDDTLGNV